MTQQVNERSTAYLAVSFLDKVGGQAAPTSVTYRIDDVASGAQVLGETSVTAGASIEIKLSPVDNAILNANLATELKRVTVVATYGANDAVRSQYVYEVRNLGGVS